MVAEAEKMGYKLDRMAISGGSAGGTLAMLYAYRDAADSPIPVKMLFEAVGPSSFYPEDWSVYGLDQNHEAAAGLFGIMAGTKITADMFGTDAYEEAIKPISGYMWVTESSVPTVCAYGVYDKVCPFDSAKHLIKALEDNNVTHTYSLLAVDCLQQKGLFFRLQVGKLHSGGHGDFLIVHHLLKLRRELSQANVALYLRFAFSCLICNNLYTFLPIKIVTNLGTIFFGLFCGSACLPFDGLQLHLVSLCAFAGQNVFTLQIGIHHDNRSGIRIEVADDDGHGFQPRQLTGMFTPMPGNDFIAALLTRTDDGRNENAVLLDALGGLLHGFIIPHLEGMIGEGVKLGQRERHDPFLRSMGGRRFVLRRFLAPFLRGGTVCHKIPPDFGYEKRAFHLFQEETPSGAAANKTLDAAADDIQFLSLT